MNKFDEVLNKLNLNTENAGYWKPYQIQLITDVIEDLRQEYAPTVEMTKGQEKTVRDEKYKDNLTGLLTGGGNYFDILFWEPLNEIQVAHAWLDPNVIKVVEGEQ